MPRPMIARKLELHAHALMRPETSKYQTEAAGQSLLELAKEVGKLEQTVPVEEEAVDDGAGIWDDFTPVLDVKDEATEWLKRHYTEEELKDVYLNEHDHARKWLPVRKT